VGGDDGDQGRAGREGGGVDAEREPGRGREQQAAHRRAGEVIGDYVGALEPPIGLLQPLPVPGDQGRDERLGGGVDQGLAAAEQKAGDHEQRDA
jgi:hypothetical protein